MSWISRHLTAPPLFIVGPSRSGTSALLRVFSRHPGIYARPSGEAPIVEPVGRLFHEIRCSRYANYHEAESNLPPEEIGARLRSLVKDWIFGPVNLRNQVKQLADTRKMRSAKFWSAKCFPSKTGLEGLSRLFPAARFVFIFRNGYDVVNSRNRYSHFKGFGFEGNVDEWVEQVDSYAYALTTADSIVVRHEDMVASPEDFLKTIWERLGMLPSAESLRTLTEELVQPEGHVNLLQKTADLKKYYAERESPTAQWSEEQRGYFAERAGNAMKLLGYNLAS